MSCCHVSIHLSAFYRGLGKGYLVTSTDALLPYRADICCPHLPACRSARGRRAHTKRSLSMSFGCTLHQSTCKASGCGLSVNKRSGTGGGCCQHELNLPRTCLSGAWARARTGAASSSNFSRVMVLRKSMSFMRHSTFSGASGMELSVFFSCRQRKGPD